MDSTTALAAYAAAVGTGGLAWQVLSWHLIRRTRMEVRVSAAILVLGSQSVPVVSVEAVNRSSHSVNVRGVGLLTQDGSGSRIIMPMPPPGATIPGIVEAHDSGSTHFAMTELQRIDIYKPITAEVRTATGTFKSKPTTIRQR